MGPLLAILPAVGEAGAAGAGAAGAAAGGAALTGAEAAAGAGAIAGAGAAGAAGGLSLAGLATATSIIGTAMGVLGGFQQAGAYGQAAKQQQVLAQQQLAMGALQEQEYNTAASNTRYQAASDALTAIRKRRLVEGQAIAQEGALGYYGGSSEDILRDMGFQGAYEVQQIMNQGETQAKSYMMAGRQARFSGYSGGIESLSQASNYNAQAGQSAIGAFGTLVGGAANTLYLYNQMQPTPYQTINYGNPQKNPLF